MPQIDTDDWNIAAQNKKGLHPPVIEGRSLDITDRLDIQDDTERLTEDPVLPEDGARDREDTDGAGNFLATLHNIPYGPVRHLKADLITSTWRLIEGLTPSIPLNDFGMPEFFYRPDLLDYTLVHQGLTMQSGAGDGTTPTTILSPVEGGSAGTLFESGTGIQNVQEHIDNAIVQLSYYEGYPTTPEGYPFWDRLICESQADYDMFRAYLELGGARKISELIAYPLDQVRELFHTYYWAYRVKAFDLYRVVNAKRQKLTRILTLEDNHYQKAEALLQRVEEAFGELKAEQLAAVPPDKLVGMFERLVKIQRISVGLPANGGNVDEDAGKASPTTIQVMQQVVQNSPESVKKTEEDVDILQDSPESVEKVQSMLIEVMRRTG